LLPGLIAELASALSRDLLSLVLLPGLTAELASALSRDLLSLVLLLRPVAKLPSTWVRASAALALLSLPGLGLWLRSRRRRRFGGLGILLPLLLGRPSPRAPLRRLATFLPRLVFVLLGVRDREAGEQQCQNCRPYPQPVGIPAT